MHLQTEAKNAAVPEGYVKDFTWAGRAQANAFTSHLKTRAHGGLEDLVQTWHTSWPLHSSASCRVRLCSCNLGPSKVRWPSSSAETTSATHHFGLVTENLILRFHQPTKKITLGFIPYKPPRAPRCLPAAHSPHREPSSIPALRYQRVTSLLKLVHFMKLALNEDFFSTYPLKL